MQSSQVDRRQRRFLTLVFVPLAFSLFLYLSMSGSTSRADEGAMLLHKRSHLASSHVRSNSMIMRSARLRSPSSRGPLALPRDGFLETMADAVTGGGGDTTAAQAGVTNPLGRGQDPNPFSREEDGVRTYYFPTIDFGTGVYMQTSTDLNTVLSVPTNEKKIFTYDKEVGTEAPAYFRWDDDNNLLVISSVGPQGNGLLRMLHSTSQDLLTGWEDLGPVKDGSGNKLVNYDGFIFQHPNGKRYLLYSALKSILITELTSFNTVGKSLTIVTGNGQVIEAPAAFISGDTLNLLWSENGFATPDYNTRRRAVSTHSDPMDPSTWRFADSKTILQSGNGVYGTGSVGVFTGPDGQPWLAYTCFYDPNGFPQSINPRRVQAQPLVIENDVIQSMEPDAPTGPTGTT
ncbi:Arabinanase/levansucrase/invertase [Acaromyces ingoldii]|uniref:Arabinanase/levansucrase/invertase n=1 Tax=Acaromyces ingoldii TaxID=215250 RepID=A0A316YT31_9BASI|nr:Arabinanase/levansucrase/invertase [Acaromyces ingoldii]PWN92710.1 Arabinanase/levansucrase/invertase [Acaromyces ingoldii]